LPNYARNKATAIDKLTSDEYYGIIACIAAVLFFPIGIMWVQVVYTSQVSHITSNIRTAAIFVAVIYTQYTTHNVQHVQDWPP